MKFSYRGSNNKKRTQYRQKGKNKYYRQKQCLHTTTKNTVISPNFLVWKFCGKAQFNRPQLCGNCPFPQSFTRRLGELTVFFAGCLDRLYNISYKLLDAKY